MAASLSLATAQWTHWDVFTE